MTLCAHQGHRALHAFLSLEEPVEHLNWPTRGWREACPPGVRHLSAGTPAPCHFTNIWGHLRSLNHHKSTKHLRA